METLMTHIRPFLGWLLNATLVGSLIVCLILLIQKTLGGKLGPRWSYALWLVLVVRMVLPWAPSSRLSLSNLIPSWDRQIQSQQSIETAPAQEIALPEQPAETTESIPDFQLKDEAAAEMLVDVTPSMVTETKAQSRPRLVSIRQLLPIIWLAGAIVVGIYLIVSDLALWRIVKRDRPLVNQPMLELFEECKAQMGIQSLVAVVPSEKVRSPGLFGFVRPRLLLPREMLDSATRDEMRYVFLHELAHLKRHDIYLGWLTSLLQVLHWFNPLIWFAFYRMRADRELACDALVLTRTGQDKSQEYGGAILGLVRRFSRLRPLPAMAGIMESKSQLKRRIAMITKFKHSSYRFSPLAAVLIIVLACISLPDAMRTKASQAAAPQPAHQLQFTKVRIPNKIPWDAQMSPDGKSIAFVNEKKIWIMPRTSRLGSSYPGAPKQLDTAGVEADWCGLTWSGDGKWIAFNGKKVEEEYQRIYVVSADGGKPKQVQENNRDVRVVNYRMSLSPKGKTLAFASVDANELYIYTIDVDGGQPIRLVNTPAREPVFSPDGKMIAYVEAKKLSIGGGGGLWTVPAAGGTPTLVAEAKNASSPVWSLDGKMLAFIDNEEDKQIHIIPLTQEGGPAGEKISIDRPEEVNGVRRLTGWTPDNMIGAVFGTPTEFALYAQPVQGGKATFITHGGYPCQPRWSPDGKRVYHTNKTDAASGDWTKDAIAWVPAEGGNVTTIPLKAEHKIRLWAYGAGNRISPDGKTIVFAGQKPEEGPKMMHIWTLPIDGGTPRQLTEAPLPFRDWYPCWSPDGNNIAFVRMEEPEKWAMIPKANIYIVSANGVSPRQVTSESDRVFSAGPVIWSPDGELLAFFSRDKDDASDGTIKVMPTDGGKSRIVAKVEGIYANTDMAWSSDSKRIACNAPDNKIKIVTLNDGSIEEIEPDLKDVNIYHLDWSPDSKTLAFGGYTGGGPEFWMMENFLPVMAVAKQARQSNFRKIRIPTKPGGGVLSPDGQRLAYISEGSLWTVPVHGKVSPDIAGEPVRLTESMGAWDVASMLAWSADEKWIAFNTSDEKGDAIYVIASSGGEPGRVPVEPRLRNSAYNYRLSLSPDGKVVAFSSRYMDESGAGPLEEPGLPPSVRGFFIYTVPVAGGQVKRLTDSSSGEPAFSPDGKMIAFVKYHISDEGQLYGSVWVVPAAGGTAIQVSEPDPKRRVGGPVWSPDSRMIAYTARTESERKEVFVVPVSETGRAAASSTKIRLPLNTLDTLAGWTRDGKIGVFLHEPGSWAIHTVPASGGQAVQVTPSGSAAHPQWSPDGRRIYFRWDGGQIAHVPSSGGQLSIGPLNSDETFYLIYPGCGNAVSPDGKEIVFCAGKKISPENKEPYWEVNIYTIPVEGGEPRKIAQEGRYPCWSPDGKSIAFIRTYQRPVKSESGWNIYIVPSKGGDVRQLTSDSDDVRRTHIDFSPDGKSIAYFAKDKTLRVIPVQGGKARIVATAEELRNHDAVAFSPDGGKLVYSSKGSIWSVSSDGGEPEEIRTGLDEKAGHVSFSPDGKKLAFTAMTAGEEDLYLIENFLPTTAVAKSDK